MKLAGFLLLVPAGFTCVGWAEEVVPSFVSQAMKAHIREGLPVFETKSPDAEGSSSETHTGPVITDSTLLVLPKLTVKEKRLPSDATRHLGKPRDFKRQMENLYLDEVAAVGRLNSFLNSVTIPLLSPSKAERGKAIMINRELDRLTELMSPIEAKSLNYFYDELAATTGSGASRRR